MFYIGTISGMSFNLHWCGGKLRSATIFKGDKHFCPCGKKPMKPGCCKDKLVLIKLRTNHNHSSFIKAPVPDFSWLLAFSCYAGSEISRYLVRGKLRIRDYHAPPFKPRPPIYLFGKSLLI
jgi:hypothetical protein